MSIAEVPVTVPQGAGYVVHIGRGALARLEACLPEGAGTALVLTQPGVGEHAHAVAARLSEVGLRVVIGEVPSGEEAKTVEEAGAWWDVCGAEGLGRGDVIVGVGGGAVTDLAGFVAAGWMRGVAVVHVPTTLLGMVDAAVGGKTGVNTALGKNLVGAFHHPVGVVCDLDTLATLPDADLVAGLAEVVKCGLIADPVILDLLEEAPALAVPALHGGRGGPCLVDVRALPLAALVQRAVQVKADVVGQDPRESSLREVLNYGHTFGHALEHAEGYRWRHGEAVAVGMVYVAELAAARGLVPTAVVERHREMLRRVGLPVAYPGRPGDAGALLEAMGRDKKSRGGALRLVTLRSVHNPSDGRAPRLSWGVTTLDPAADAAQLEQAREAVRT